MSGHEMDLKERTKWIIIDVIKKHGLSNEKLAQKIGYNKGTINNYRRKINVPNGDFIETFCKTFHVNPVWFITGVGEHYIEKNAEVNNASDPNRPVLKVILNSEK